MKSNFVRGFYSLLGILAASGVAILVVVSLREVIPAEPRRTLRAGFIEEFLLRRDCFPRLEERYGIVFPYQPRVYPNWLIYSRLEEGEVHVIGGNSTSGDLPGRDFIVLEDDKQAFPPYEAAPLIRKDLVAGHPGISRALALLGGSLTVEKIQKLNHRVLGNGESPKDVALEFLETGGLLAKARKLKRDPLPCTPDTRPDSYKCDAPVRIGSKRFAESKLLAYLMKIIIDEGSGHRGEVNPGIGGTATCFSKLKEGKDLHLYPEYTGTGLELLDEPGLEPPQEPDHVYQHVREQFRSEFDLEWLPRFGFNNTWALIMRTQDADRMDIEAVSDLARVLSEQSRRLPGGGVNPLSRRTFVHEPVLPSISDRLSFLNVKRQPPLDPVLEPGEEQPKPGEPKRDEEEIGRTRKDLLALTQVITAGPQDPQLELHRKKREFLEAFLIAQSYHLVMLNESEAVGALEIAFERSSGVATDRERLEGSYRWVAKVRKMYHVAQLTFHAWQSADEKLRRYEEEASEHPDRTPDASRSLWTDRITTGMEDSHVIKTQLIAERKRAQLQLDTIADIKDKSIPPKTHPAPLSIGKDASIEDLRIEKERRFWEAENALLEAERAQGIEDIVRYVYDIRLEELKEADSQESREVLAKKARELANSLETARKNATVARIRSESYQRVAEESQGRLDQAEMGRVDDILTRVALAILIASATLAVAFGVYRFIDGRQSRVLEGVTDAEKRKRIEMPFLIIERTAVPAILITGGLLTLIQFQVFQELGTTVLASAGVLSLVAGFAARSLLGNAMAGVTLCFSQPLRVGDTVSIGSEYGKIEDVGLLHTTFATWDNRRIIIPNEALAAKEVVNYTIKDEKQWVKVPIHLDYGADIQKAKAILLDVVKKSPHWSGKDEPQVWFMELGEQTIKLWVAAWADNPGQGWSLSCDILDNALKRFQEEGIALPRQRVENLEDSNGRPSEDSGQAKERTARRKRT